MFLCKDWTPSVPSNLGAPRSTVHDPGARNRTVPASRRPAAFGQPCEVSSTSTVHALEGRDETASGTCGLPGTTFGRRSIFISLFWSEVMSDPDETKGMSGANGSKGCQQPTKTPLSVPKLERLPKAMKSQPPRLLGIGSERTTPDFMRFSEREREKNRSTCDDRHVTFRARGLTAAFQATGWQRGLWGVKTRYYTPESTHIDPDRLFGPLGPSGSAPLRSDPWDRGRPPVVARTMLSGRERSFHD